MAEEVKLPLAYESGTAAMRELLVLREHGGQITNSSESLRVLPNGLPYYFVEVTSRDGTKYVIETYGEEAVTLGKEESSIRTKPLVLA
jgi:hypothetical protein